MGDSLSQLDDLLFKATLRLLRYTTAIGVCAAYHHVIQSLP